MRRGRRRVLMTVDAVGGVWTYAVDLAEGLATHGVDCTLAVFGTSPNADQLARAATVPSLVLHHTGLQLDWLARSCEEVLFAGEAVSALAKEVGADLVHLNAPALAAGGAFTLPVVAVCHSCVKTWWQSLRGDAMPPDFAWQADLVARGYAAAHALVAPTRAFGKLTRDSYGLFDTPVVVRNGRRAPASPMLAPPADTVFTAGRLWDEGKNVAALDRIAARLPWDVVAAGPTEGPDGTRIALHNIRILGRIDPAGVARQLAARPLFISLARYEPFGLAVLEAAQAGCVLLLSDHPGFRELWGDAAVFLSPEDEAGAVSTIGQLMRDRPARERLGRRAAERAARYSVAAMADGMVQIYRALLDVESAA